MTLKDQLLELPTKTIDKESVAIEVIIRSIPWFFIAAGVNAAFGVLYLHEPAGWATAAGFAALTLWLRASRGPIPAALLMFLSLINVLDRLVIVLDGGWTRVIPLLVGLYVLVLSVRVVEACVKLPKLAQHAAIHMTESGGRAAPTAGKTKVYGKKQP